MVAARLRQRVAVAVVLAPSPAVAGGRRRGAVGDDTLGADGGVGIDVAIGPTPAGLLFEVGFAAPFLFGEVGAVLGLGLVYTQVIETLDGAAAVPGD